MYTTIIHPIRKAHNLSCNEYVILDTIYHLSNNQKYGGWCVASKPKIAKWLDLSRATVFRGIEALIQKGLIEKDEETGWIRTKDLWNEQIANKNDWLLGFEGKESQYLSGNVKKRNETGSLNPTLDPSQNETTPRLKMRPYNNKDNNNNNINSSKDELRKPQYGNPDINKMLQALKAKIEIDSFVDSSIERNMAKHCLTLMQKIGKDEFVRRLDILLEDSFYSKNMNKIKYVYNNIKGFKEPPKRVAIIS